jgi:aminoglycoside phosphotransferase (APT) family kinase protein
VYQWLDGTPASAARIVDLSEVAVVLARFLACLQKIDPTEEPPPPPAQLLPCGPLETYDAETRKAIATVQGMINTELATEVWETALATIWYGGPVWIHGDVAAGNLQADQAAAATARRAINEVLDEHVHAV